MNTPTAPEEHRPDFASKLLLSIVPDTTTILNVGRSTVYELIAAGELETVKVGSRRFVIPASVEAYVRRLRSAS